MGNSSGSAAQTTDPGTWACELVKAPRSTIETNALLGVTLKLPREEGAPGHPLLLRVSETGLRLTDRRVLSKKENMGKAVCDYPLAGCHTGASQVQSWKAGKKDFTFVASEDGQSKTFVVLTPDGAQIVAAIVEAVALAQVSAGKKTTEEPGPKLRHQPEPEPEPVESKLRYQPEPEPEPEFKR